MIRLCLDVNQEDAGVLNAAMAGRAGVLVTSNLTDFIRGPTAPTDTEVLSRYRGSADAVRLHHPRLRDGLVIASPFRAAGWLLRDEPPPPGVLATPCPDNPGP